MAWSMLQGRMEALRLNLERARDLSVEEPALGHVLLGQGVWDAAFAAIRDDSVTRIEELDALTARLDFADLESGWAWQEFAQIQEQSEDVFLECLELMGGLAFRDRELDNEICRFANELINECAGSIGRPLTTIVVPSHNGALSTGLRRIAHVRFPEWDVWTLPIVAHEYGRLAIAEHEKLDEFARTVTNGLHGGLADSQTVELDAVEQRFRVLLADAFATYTIGPAYACSLMLLRLDFVSPTPACREFARQRVEMVSGILDLIDEQGNIKNSLHNELSKYWNQAVESLPAPSPGALDPLQSLAPNPETVFNKFKSRLLPTAVYSPEDWATATLWGLHWLRQIKAGTSPSVPQVEPRHRLRDALNASWYVRIRKPTWVTEGAEVTQELCQQIIDVRGQGEGRTGLAVQSGTRPARGVR